LASHAVEGTADAVQPPRPADSAAAATWPHLQQCKAPRCGSGPPGVRLLRSKGTLPSAPSACDLQNLSSSALVVAARISTCARAPGARRPRPFTHPHLTRESPPARTAGNRYVTSKGKLVEPDWVPHRRVWVGGRGRLFGPKRGVRAPGLHRLVGRPVGAYPMVLQCDVAISCGSRRRLRCVQSCGPSCTIARLPGNRRGSRCHQAHRDCRAGWRPAPGSRHPRTAAPYLARKKRSCASHQASPQAGGPPPRIDH